MVIYQVSKVIFFGVSWVYPIFGQIHHIHLALVSCNGGIESTKKCGCKGVAMPTDSYHYSWWGLCSFGLVGSPLGTTIGCSYEFHSELRDDR